MTILLYTLFLTYPCLSGFKDAVLWSGRSYNAVKWDLHMLFAAERISFGLSAFVPALFVYHGLIDIYNVIIALISLGFSFPFFHNGFYYKGREYIDVAYKGWFDYSYDYKSFWNFTPFVRTLLLVLGLLILLIYEIIY